MNDKEYRAESRRVNAMLKKWSPFFSLDGWDIRVAIVRGHKGVSCAGESLAADVTCQWQYMNAHMNVYAESTVEISDYELEETIVHELVHIMVAELAPDVHSDSEERVVTGLARAFLRLAEKK